MAASSSSWNSSGFAFAPNTNTMDPESMPSDKAEAARRKADEVMAALRKGEPGDADKIMGSQKETGTKGITPLGHIGKKLFGKREKKNEEAKVVR